MIKKKPTTKPKWIKFNATKDSVCPVDPETMVEVKLRDVYAVYFNWDKSDNATITHYRIVKKAAKKSAKIHHDSARPLGSSGNALHVQNSTSKQKEATLAHGDTTKLYTQEWLDKQYNEGYEKGFKESLDSLHRIELWQVLFIYFIGIVGGFAIRGIWQ